MWLTIDIAFRCTRCLFFFGRSYFSSLDVVLHFRFANRPKPTNSRWGNTVMHGIRCSVSCKLGVRLIILRVIHVFVHLISSFFMFVLTNIVRGAAFLHPAGDVVVHHLVPFSCWKSFSSEAAFLFLSPWILPPCRMRGMGASERRGGSKKRKHLSTALL